MIDHVHLSPEGQARRARILDEARRAQRGRIRRRQAARGAAGLVIIALVAIVPFQFQAGPPAPQQPESPSSQSSIQIVRTTAPSVEHIAIAPVESAVEHIGDEELLELLRAAGHDEAGLIRAQGRVVILGADVTTVDADGGSTG